LPPPAENILFINHGYTTLYNKISGYSMNQWIPRSMDTCRRLIYDALSSDAIKEVEIMEGQVVDRWWILHHFDFDSFCIFGFLDDFAMPTACSGSSATRRHDSRVIFSRHFILGIFVVTSKRHRLSTCPLVLSGWCLFTATATCSHYVWVIY
jgi:hypothetical protein